VLLAIAAVSGLIYTYYESIQNRKRIEKDIQLGTKLEPFEIQMLRSSNAVSLDEYKAIIENLSRNFLSWSSKMEYEGVVKMVQDVLSKSSNMPPYAEMGVISRSLQLGYLLDRSVLAHLIEKFESIEMHQKVGYQEVSLPIHYFVALLNLTMESNVNNRVEGLYFACTKLSEKNIAKRGDQLKRCFEHCSDCLHVLDCAEILIDLVQSLVDTDQVIGQNIVEPSFTWHKRVSLNFV
jgi:hypothetical protein